MASILTGDITISGNLSVASTLSVAGLQTTAGFDIVKNNWIQGYPAPAAAIGFGPEAYHTAIVMPDGTVRGCGRNDSGALGQNDLINRSTVVPFIGISSQAIAVACGTFFTAILMNNGTVLTCGRNQFGQLGQNDLITRSTVVSVLGISSQAIAVACGHYHAAILMNDGTVRVYGINNNGQLGQNDTTNRSTPVPVLGISSQAIAVACGYNHTAILMNNGTVRVCGRNAEGQLGLNDLTERDTPVPVLGISSQAVAIACGFVNTAIVMNDGTVRVCGQNSFGQLGLNDLVTRSTVVSVLGISSQAIGVACSNFFTVILMNNGTVRACGDNTYGQLGQNDTVVRSTVVSILGISSQAVAVTCGAAHTAILLNDGSVKVTGFNAEGQLGQNNTAYRSTVVPVLNIVPYGQAGYQSFVPVKQIGIGCLAYHAAIVMADGTVMVCGQNANGQLGQNDKTNRSTLVPVLGISSQALAVSCGQNHTAVLINDGTVRVCGRNTFGQLGQNDTVDRSTVVSILGISSQAVAVACGANFTAVLMNDGTVRVCGVNNNAQLGQNDLVTRSTVVSILGISSQAIAVACGVNSTTVLINDGTVRVCGRNDNGQLGQNDLVTRSTVVSILGISSQAVAIACGAYHTLVLLNDGTVRACGLNNNGQLGQNDLVTRSTVVSVLGISSQAIALACGRYFTSILMNNGTVRVCGQNDRGQLGQNDLVTRSTVVSVLGISSQAVAVACGSVNMAILMNDGTVDVCGVNNNGRLGLNDTVTRSTVVTMLGTAPLPFSQVCYTSGWDGKNPIGLAQSSQARHVAILMNDGTVRVSGNNSYGALGQNDMVRRSTLVPILGISSQAIAVASGRYHTVILMNDGTVRGCGHNSSGELGQNNTSIVRQTPVPILGISSQAIAVACGREYTAIVMNDGTVRVCGDNSNGQLGQNDLTTRSTPVPILGISSQAIAVACGQYHTAILMNDGTVRVCGLNQYGQLGQNDLITRSTVVSVLGISSQAIAVACGYAHTAILMNDGTVRVCGANYYGQLGQNDLVTRSTVVSILGISSQAIAVACGADHTVILMNDGTVRVCGDNSDGQLGQNSVLRKSTLVQVLGISSQAIGITCGLFFTTILMNNGTVRVCGDNFDGQLGQNNTVDRLTVVSVPGISGNTYLVMGSLALGVQTPSLYQLDLSTDNARKLTTTTWTTGSDMRIKSDIQTANLARCSEIIDALDLKYFEWSPDIDVKDRHSLGWIAQDVEQFFPNSVRTAPAHGITDFKNLNSDQLIKAMYGALKNMIQKTYPPTGAADASNTQA